MAALSLSSLTSHIAVGPHKSSQVRKASAKQQAKTEKVELIRAFEFFSLDDVIQAANGMGQIFDGANALYRYGNEDSYQLILHQSGQSPEDFNRVCNQLSEYARGEAYSMAGEAYLKEHAKCIISDQALRKLAQLCD